MGGGGDDDVKASTLGEKILWVLVGAVLLLLVLVVIALTAAGGGKAGGGGGAGGIEYDSLTFSRAALVAYEDRETFVCNVNLIGRQWALTTATCVRAMLALTEHHPDDDVLWYVKAGMGKWTRTGIIRYVAMGVAHEGFDPKTYANNIGLIRVEEGFDGIEFPSFAPNSGKCGLVVGWRKPSFSIILMESKHSQKKAVPLGASECESKFPAVLRDGVSGNATFCLAYEEEDAHCYPEDGYAFVVDGKFVGIKSWGDNCISGMPQIMIAVDKYAKWIEKKIGKKL